MTSPDADAQNVSELLINSTGIWRIFTIGSTHVLNLDAGTMRRIPGPGSFASINDCERRLRSLDACRVGERGRWSMLTDDWTETVDFYWHLSSIIIRIERLTPTDERQ